MTGPQPNPNRKSLDLDELIAIVVAFSVLGTILWWTLGQKTKTWPGQLSGLGERLERSGREDKGAAVAPGAISLPSPDLSAAPEPSLPARTPVVVVPPPVVVSPQPLPPSAPAPPTPDPTAAAPAAPATITVPQVGAAAVTFSDVPEGHWAYPFIHALNQRGMLGGVGDGSFQPDQPVTRAQYAALLSEVLKGPRQSEISFSDVQTNSWEAQPIEAAVRAGFLEGYPDQTFQPADLITKMEVILSLVNGLQLPKPQDPEAALQALSDRDQVPEWARPALGAAAQADVVVNYPDVDRLRPDQPATRAEVAALLYQALQTTGQVPPLESPYIVHAQ